MTKPKQPKSNHGDNEPDAATLVALMFNAKHGDRTARDNLDEAIRKKRALIDTRQSR